MEETYAATDNANCETVSTEHSRRDVLLTFVRRPMVIISLSASLVLITAVIFIICTVFSIARDVTVELDAEPDYGHVTNSGFASAVCDLLPDPASLTTDNIVKHKVTYRFFGFINVTRALRVVDTTPPRIYAKSICITEGMTVDVASLEHFVRDKTKTSLTLDTSALDVFVPGEYDLTLSATDAGGNTVSEVLRCTVSDKSDRLCFEEGISRFALSYYINDLFPDVEGLELPQTDGCGKYTAVGESDDTLFLLGFEIADNIVPEVTVSSFDLVLGERVTPYDILRIGEGGDGLSTSLSSMPDFNTAGEYNIYVTVADPEGHRAEYLSCIRIHDVNTELTVEVHSQNSTLSAGIFNDSDSRDNLSLDGEYVTLHMSLGENLTYLKGEFNNIPLTLNVVDTIEPMITLDNVRALIGSDVSAGDFVSSCLDETAVKYSFVEEPDTDSVGMSKVTVTATDAAGNTSQGEAFLIVFTDETPPTFEDVTDVVCAVGDKPLYYEHVRVTDKYSENPTLSVDFSRVDTSREGRYPITYMTEDDFGNIATAEAFVQVVGEDAVCIDVANILQMPKLPNGCEVVSLAIALKHAGYPVDPLWLFESCMPTSVDGDPWETYLGDPTGLGMGCYAPCVVTTGNNYLSLKDSDLTVKNISGKTVAEYEEYINRGTPVILWGTIDMNCSDEVFSRWYVDGREMVWHTNSHCLVLIGYTEDTYILCDPMEGIVEYDKDDVERSSEIMFSQACIIE